MVDVADIRASKQADAQAGLERFVCGCVLVVQTGEVLPCPAVAETVATAGELLRRGWSLTAEERSHMAACGEAIKSHVRKARGKTRKAMTA